MPVTLAEMMKQLPVGRQEKIKAATDRRLTDYLALQELRRAKALTQVQLAQVLGVKQATVAQMEKRSDLLLSTLRSYIEAMGGKLTLSVEFPDRPPVYLTGLGDTDTLPPR